jgi:diguanylate cyclase (GGDEF)-like protein/PAS domain S-box-containing protein
MTDTHSTSLPPPLPGFQLAVQLLDHLVVPTFVIDREGRVIIWNRACERLTGLPAKKVLGTRRHWRAFYPTPRPLLADLVLQRRLSELESFYDSYLEEPAVAGMEQVVHAESWCDMPRLGQQLYLALDAGPVYDEAGELVGVVQSLRDMTREKRTHAELERLVTRDGLTGLVNRRHFDHLLHKEWARLRREQGTLSLVMVDVDHFKAYNDLYGHVAGDLCLQRAASVFTDSVLRPSDVVARYGGEEFALVLPDTDMAGAETVAQRIQQGMQELNIAHQEGEGGRVTVSMGLATVNPSAGATPAQLLVMADDALYRAKHAGRNRFVQHSLSLMPSVPVVADAAPSTRPG